MKEADRAGAEQLAGDPAERRAADHLLVLADPLPVAKVLDERAGLAGLGRVHPQRAELAEVALDAALERRQLVRTQSAPDDGDPVAAKLLDDRVLDRPLPCQPATHCLASSSSSSPNVFSSPGAIQAVA